MARKRKASSTPRRKRMGRQARRAHARSTGWVSRYQGKNIVKSYRKWFGVDWLSAVRELRLLGVDVPAEREAEIRRTLQAGAGSRRKAKKKAPEAPLSELEVDSDDTFAFIAGHTSGGAPYGVTWEEMEKLSPGWKKDPEW